MDSDLEGLSRSTVGPGVFREVAMTVHLDHLIVPSRNRTASARLIAELLGVPWSEESGVGPFSAVYVDDGLTLDFDETSEPFPIGHFAFRVEPAEFTAILGRIKAAGISYRSTPHGSSDMQVNTGHGGSIVYWNEPDGHVWEILTLSYARLANQGSHAMPQKERAQRLSALHVKGDPLVLYNAWDAGSARAIASAGSVAIATSSWAVAAAHGYEDGESIPLPFVEQVIARIVGAVDVPVTVDVEGGYSDDPHTCAENVARLIDRGVAGINFEDRIVAGDGLHGIEAQCKRIAAIRRVADERGIPLFINARTDLFFGPGAAADGLAEARKRAEAYAEAGASGFFVPGLVDLDVIAGLCDTIGLPLNVMVMPGLPDARALASAGVARISHGPGPYRRAMETVRLAAQDVLAVEPGP